MKKPRYKLKSNLYKTLGTTSIVGGGISGFLGYQFYNGWEDFVEGASNLIVIQESTMKLNVFLALPMFLSLLITFFVFKKKNKELFSNKLSLNLLLITGVTFIIYSIIGITFFTFLGLLGGSIIEETTFGPLANKNLKNAQKLDDFNEEYEKEKIRVEARKEAGGLDGSV